MTCTILEPEDCQPVGREFAYWCPDCGIVYHSDHDLIDPNCDRTFIWPDTKGYKKLIRARNAREADAKAKQKAENLPEVVKQVLVLAREGAIDPRTVFVSTFLNEKQRERRDAGNVVLTEQQVLTGHPAESVLQLAQSLYNANERGRGLIVHLVNKLQAGGGKVAPQGGDAGNSVWVS